MYKVFPARDANDKPGFIIGHTVDGHTLPLDGPPELFAVEGVAQKVCDALNSPSKKTRFIAHELFAKGTKVVTYDAVDAIDHDAATPEPFPLVPPDLTHEISKLVMLYGPELVKLAAERY